MRTRYVAAISAACAIRMTGMIVATGLAATDHAAAAGTSYDILGVALGMSPDQVRQVISAKGPEWKFQTIKYPSGNTDTIIAAHPNLMSPMEEKIIVWFTGIDQKVEYVGRQVVFPPDKQPALTTLEQSLIAKYGPVSASQFDRNPKSFQNPKFYWAYDPSGIQLKGPGVFAATGCLNPYGRPVGGYIPTIQSGRIFSAPNLVYPQLQERCGVGVSVEVGRNPDNLDVVAGIAEELMDQHARFLDLKNMQAQTRQREEEERQKQLEGAKKTAAPL
jgi:hypothetical protein